MERLAAKPYTCPACGERTKTSRNWQKIFIHNNPGKGRCWTSGLTPWAAENPARIKAAAEAASKPVTRPIGPALPLAPWFPRWDGNAYPSIALFSRRRMAYWLPETSSGEHEEKIKDLLGKQVRAEWESEYACWTVSDAHFLDLAFELLRRYPKLSIGREYFEDEPCFWQCERAQGWRCTCSCQARNHAGGRWMNGWNILSEDTRVTDRINWSWMAVETA